MPGCGESEAIPEGTFETGPGDNTILRSKLMQGVENFREEWAKETKARAAKRDAEDTNPPFIRDLSVPELEEVIEKCVRRVLQGEDLKREWAKLEAIRKVIKK